MQRSFRRSRLCFFGWWRPFSCFVGQFSETPTFSSQIFCLHNFYSGVRILGIQRADYFIHFKISMELPLHVIHFWGHPQFQENFYHIHTAVIHSLKTAYYLVLLQNFITILCPSFKSFIFGHLQYHKNYEHDLIYTQLSRYTLKSYTNLRINTCHDRAYFLWEGR